MAMELDMTESAVFEICAKENQAKFAKDIRRRVKKMCSHFMHGKRSAGRHFKYPAQKGRA
jgi:hypothetical protein